MAGCGPRSRVGQTRLRSSLKSLVPVAQMHTPAAARRGGRARRATCRQVGDIGRHVAPMFSAIARHGHNPVIAPRPDHAPFDRRLRNSDESAGNVLAVGSDSSRTLLFALVVRREVRTDHRPCLAAIRRHVHELRPPPPPPPSASPAAAHGPVPRIVLVRTSMCCTFEPLLTHRMLSSLRSGIAHPLSAPIVHSQKSGGMIPVPFGSWPTAPAPVLARRLLLGPRYAGPSCRLPKR